MEGIILSNNAAKDLKALLLSRSYSKVAVLLDEHTREFCLPLISSSVKGAHIIEIKSGELNKNLDTCSFIWQELTKKQFDRKSVIINLGGGVIGDMGGFCAATFKRGIDFINVPTTLLSQVDASVGGKLGIDFQKFKNHIGVFKNPVSVIVNINFLKTLPNREVNSGIAEIIKHHLIADNDGWKKLSKDIEITTELVEHSIKVKSKVVSSDPLEAGYRKILNFGHTVGHAIETLFLEMPNPLLHGEAIAIGMICEAFISQQRQLLSADELQEIESLIISVFGKTKIDNNMINEALLLTLQDKKNMNGKVLFSLLRGIGNAVWDEEVDEHLIAASLRHYQNI